MKSFKNSFDAEGKWGSMLTKEHTIPIKGRLFQGPFMDGLDD